MGRGVTISLAVLLFISLAANVFALGHMSGRAIIGHPPPPHMRGHDGHGGFEDPFKVMRYADDLAPELRQQFRGSFRKQLPVMRNAFQEMGSLHRELGALMSAEEWDEAAINAKLDEIRTIKDRQHDAFSAAFLDIFKTLPAADRKRLIDTANERRAERRHKRWKGGRKERRGPPPSEALPPPEEG